MYTSTENTSLLCYKLSDIKLIWKTKKNQYTKQTFPSLYTFHTFPSLYNAILVLTDNPSHTEEVPQKTRIYGPAQSMAALAKD